MRRVCPSLARAGTLLQGEGGPCRWSDPGSKALRARARSHRWQRSCCRSEPGPGTLRARARSHRWQRSCWRSERSPKLFARERAPTGSSGHAAGVSRVRTLFARERAPTGGSGSCCRSERGPDALRTRARSRRQRWIHAVGAARARPPLRAGASRRVSQSTRWGGIRGPSRADARNGWKSLSVPAGGGRGQAATGSGVAWARPPASTISATRPSPRMVAPDTPATRL